MRLGAPKMGLNVLYGYRPDAPVFFNLFPGFWTGNRPPKEILYSTPFKDQGYFTTKTPSH